MATPHAINQMFTYGAVVHAPRRPPAMTLHLLEAILTITMLATLGGAQNWVEIDQWGPAPHQWLSDVLDLRPGIPAHATFGRVCAGSSPRAPAGLAGRAERAGASC